MIIIPYMYLNIKKTINQRKCNLFYCPRATAIYVTFIEVESLITTINSRLCISTQYLLVIVIYVIHNSVFEAQLVKGVDCEFKIREFDQRPGHITCLCLVMKIFLLPFPTYLIGMTLVWYDYANVVLGTLRLALVPIDLSTARPNGFMTDLVCRAFLLYQMVNPA